MYLTNNIKYCYIILIILLTYNNGYACNRGDHHSIMHHYNSSESVFKGRVLWVGRPHRKKESFIDVQTEISCAFVLFEVLEAFKGCQVGQQLCIGVLPAVLTNFVPTTQHLIYASKDINYAFLITETTCAFNDSLGISKHQLLLNLDKKHNGYLQERSATGETWAEGRLKNGQPEGPWKYYALSGELQISGSYSEGLAVGKWQTFYHTSDQNYKIFKAIQSGALAYKTSAYHFIGLDSSKDHQFRYQITYSVNQDTMQEFFYHNKLLLAKEIDYFKGLKNGKELSYAVSGDLLKEYNFINDQLEGPFVELRFENKNQGNFIRVKGHYRADRKVSENQYIYQNNQLIQVINTLK